MWQTDGRTDFTITDGRFQNVTRPIKRSRVFVELQCSTILEGDWSFSISATAAAAAVVYVIIQVRRSFILHDASATATPARLRPDHNRAAIIEYSIQSQTGFSYRPSTSPYKYWKLNTPARRIARTLCVIGNCSLGSQTTVPLDHASCVVRPSTYGYGYGFSVVVVVVVVVVVLVLVLVLLLLLLLILFAKLQQVKPGAFFRNSVVMPPLHKIGF